MMPMQKREPALIHGYLGPDHKVINMAAFYSALVQALKEAREDAEYRDELG
jgi:hypothetical protein